MTVLRPRARLVSSENGKKVFVYTCGKNFCDGTRFQARLIDTVAGQKRFAFVSECRHPTTFQPIEFVLKAVVPPFGISTVVKFQLNLVSTPTNACFGSSRCPTVDLIWDGAVSWLGTITLMAGSIGIEFKWTGTEFRVIFTGCLTGFIPAAISCPWPFTAGGGAPLGAVDASCCGGISQPNPTVVTYTVSGYTKWRYVARLVDVVNGKKRFAVSNCCVTPPDCPVLQDCCGCEVNPLQWSFPVAGVANGTCAVCTNFNTTWTITNSATCTWTADHPGICTPGTPWSLNCDAGAGVWRLTTSNFGGHSAIYELPVADWKCFGPNLMVRTQDYAVACSGFPSTLLLTAV